MLFLVKYWYLKQCETLGPAASSRRREAKFKKLLWEALESGILQSKVGMLKLIPKARTASLGIIR